MGHFFWPVTCAHMGKQLNPLIYTLSYIIRPMSFHEKWWAGRYLTQRGVSNSCNTNSNNLLFKFRLAILL